MAAVTVNDLNAIDPAEIADAINSGHFSVREARIVARRIDGEVSTDLSDPLFTVALGLSYDIKREKTVANSRISNVMPRTRPAALNVDGQPVYNVLIMAAPLGSKCEWVTARLASGRKSWLQGVQEAVAFGTCAPQVTP